MREELRHIDLIDKHLTGHLNDDEKSEVERLLAEDKEFAKELEVYKKIYTGIESKEDQKLRAKLDLLYAEYRASGEQKPKGLYRRLIIYSGAAAACIVLGILFYVFKSKGDGPLSNDAPNVVGVDSVRTQPADSLVLKKNNIQVTEKEELPEDELDGSPQDETQFAFSNGKSLPSESIRQVRQPSSLTHTFNGQELVLYGDSGISGLQLQMGKDQKGNYYLKYGDKLFNLAISSTINPLEEVQTSYTFGGIQDESVQVKVMPLIANSQPYSGFTVSVSENSSMDKNYFFLEQNEKKQLVINANMDIDSITVMVVSKSEGNSYYLIHKNELYPLNIDTTETTSLEEIDFTKNNETRMFMDRPSFPKGVYEIIF
ncbi:hypothetical protein [Flagellimonas okinawensis]|uniref:FecR protein domain-containing protein n=1 Tax=Flagellimonas okinawensis TaxID=3031324 RepID=A0ABT5XNF5_9FLAO|nr:hypothetical protein [[Muricauda] okinawensis]MDF0707418.1 hypothetical protein [[Muricauda] okinawensis]